MKTEQLPPLIICLNRLLPIAAATAICDHYNSDADVRVLWRKQRAVWLALASKETLHDRDVYVIGIPHQFRDDGTDQHILDFIAQAEKHAKKLTVWKSNQPYLEIVEKECGFVPNLTPGWMLLKEYQLAYIAYLKNERKATKGLPPHVTFIHGNPAIAGVLTCTLSIRSLRLFLRANALGIENYAYRGSIANQFRNNNTLVG